MTKKAKRNAISTLCDFFHLQLQGRYWAFFFECCFQYKPNKLELSDRYHNWSMLLFTRWKKIHVSYSRFAELKKRRTSHSIYGAEVLSSTEAVRKIIDMKLAHFYTLKKETITHELNVDSKILYDIIITLQRENDHWFYQTVRHTKLCFNLKTCIGWNEFIEVQIYLTYSQNRS